MSGSLEQLHNSRLTYDWEEFFAIVQPLDFAGHSYFALLRFIAVPGSDYSFNGFHLPFSHYMPGNHNPKTCG